MHSAMLVARVTSSTTSDWRDVPLNETCYFRTIPLWRLSLEKVFTQPGQMQERARGIDKITVHSGVTLLSSLPQMRGNPQTTAL